MKKTMAQMLVAGGLALMTGCVGSQDMMRLENRINALEMESSRHLEQLNAFDRKLTELQTRTGNSGRMNLEKYAELKSLLAQWRNDIQTLTGRVESVEHSVSRRGGPGSASASGALQRLDNAVTRNYQRIVIIESHLGLEPSRIPPADAADGTDTSAPNEAGMYQSAKALLDTGDNEGARKGFEAFIKAFPDSANADNARFWIADSYYRDKWYEKAILEYQVVIENYSQGNKVPAALLKQGYAFANLGEKGNARLILKELIRRYPGSSEAKIAGEKLESLK